MAEIISMPQPKRRNSLIDAWSSDHAEDDLLLGQTVPGLGGLGGLGESSSPQFQLFGGDGISTSPALVGGNDEFVEKKDSAFAEANDNAGDDDDLLNGNGDYSIFWDDASQNDTGLDKFNLNVDNFRSGVGSAPPSLMEYNTHDGNYDPFSNSSMNHDSSSNLFSLGRLNKSVNDFGSENLLDQRGQSQSHLPVADTYQSSFQTGRNNNNGANGLLNESHGDLSSMNIDPKTNGFGMGLLDFDSSIFVPNSTQSILRSASTPLFQLSSGVNTDSDRMPSHMGFGEHMKNNLVKNNNVRSNVGGIHQQNYSNDNFISGSSMQQQQHQIRPRSHLQQRQQQMQAMNSKQDYYHDQIQSPIGDTRRNLRGHGITHSHSSPHFDDSYLEECRMNMELTGNSLSRASSTGSGLNTGVLDGNNNSVISPGSEGVLEEFEELLRSKGNFGEDSAECIVMKGCIVILREALNNALKAVELANTLRARIGTEYLAQIRERWGGLLAMLEREPTIFRVERIPKNDTVALISSQQHANNGNDLALNSSTTNIFGGNNFPTLPDERQSPAPSNSREQGASRCLHVGNVPPNLSEAQLYREFERFGDLEGLKIVTQRSRRFAFVTFVTVEQAVSAKQRLVKLPHWRSAISFAKKESITPPQPPKNLVPKGINMQGYSTASQNLYYQSLQSGDKQVAHNMNLQNFNDEQNTMPIFNSGTGVENQQIRGLNVNHMTYNQSIATKPNQYTPSSQIIQSMGQLPHDQTHAEQPCAVLKRLCDGTFVPTRAWPIDVAQDSIYCQAVVQQLHQFNGSTSISKLRGALRNRLMSLENIKSVSLKAMLAAYPNLFSVQSNTVSLVGNF